jgi:SOS response regulatory protein OraA/RecX
MDSVDQATRDIDDRTTAMDLARERGRKTRASSYEAFAAKVGGFLRRRGFDYDVTAQATRNAWNEIQNDLPAPDEAMEANA